MISKVHSVLAVAVAVGLVAMTQAQGTCITPGGSHPYDGFRCRQNCAAVVCAVRCVGCECGLDCTGANCAEGCRGFRCGARCIGANCGFATRGHESAVACNGANCGTQCQGFECAKTCIGVDCAKACVGERCGHGCSGVECAKACTGWQCAANCNGLNCNVGCVGEECDCIDDPTGASPNACTVRDPSGPYTVRDVVPRAQEGFMVPPLGDNDEHSPYCYQRAVQPSTYPEAVAWTAAGCSGADAVCYQAAESL